MRQTKSQQQPADLKASIRTLIYCLLCTSAIGCVNKPSNKDKNAATLATPRTISTLQAQTNTQVFIHIKLNNQTIVERSVVGAQQSEFILDKSIFEATNNQLDISFSITPNNATANNEYELASARVVFSSISSDQIIIPPLQYQYTDNDQDGIADVHEWLISPIDIDSDNLINSLDNDSDNDGAQDGLDPSPYGDDLSGPPSDTLTQLSIQAADSETFSVSVLQNQDYPVDTFADFAEPIPFRSPSAWPFSADDIGNTARSSSLPWDAIDITKVIQEQCPDWRIPTGTSAIESSLNGAALLLFQRAGTEHALVPLANGQVSLANMRVDVPSALFGELELPLNEALMAILVAPFSTGWVTLWSDPNFSGDSCTINLTQSRPIF